MPEEAVLLSIETPQAAPASRDDTIRVTDVTERFFPFQRFSAIFRLPKRTGGGRTSAQGVFAAAKQENLYRIPPDAQGT